MNIIEGKDNYQDLRNTIDEARVWLEEYPDKYKEIRNDIRHSLARVKEIEISWQDEKSKIAKKSEEENALNWERTQKDAELGQASKSLEEILHQDALQELISEQPVFEEALRGQVETYNSERFSGLTFETENIDTDLVTQTIIQRIENVKDFDGSTIQWRTAKAQYDEQMKDICDAKLRGRQLTSQDAYRRFEPIIGCLQAQETVLFK